MAESAGRRVVGFGTRTSKLEVLKVAKDLESAKCGSTPVDGLATGYPKPTCTWMPAVVLGPLFPRLESKRVVRERKRAGA